jgi:uroporphyrin-III C-methyltransferase / precorrin-2 dehydrogenase / sirohydrochlorin ferrochelatase
MDHLPIFLQLHGRPVVVVGGGHVAARKVELLLRSGARVSVIAPSLGEDLLGRVEAGELLHTGAPFAPSQLDTAELVVAATSLREVNAAVSRAARERRIPVNVVDDPELSTFIFPALVDRSPLVVAVSSAGHAPVLARRLREQLEALLPARLGALARFMGMRRKAVRSELPPAARRSFWERVVRGVVGARVLAGDESGAQKAFERELYASHVTSSASGRGLGEVYLIGAGPGDPDLLTLRALQLLQQADVVLYDRLVPEAVLERARREAQRVFVGKQAGESTAQERINELLIGYARQGLRVARLKGGDPLIFGRGGEEMEVLAAHGIPCIVVPGITAALGAAAAAGIPLTHRLVSQSVTFVAGHVLDDETLDWAHLASAHQTVVFYMGVAQLARIVDRLRAAGLTSGHPVALIERATLPEQRVFRGTLATIAAIASEADVNPPALLIVGEVAALASADALTCLAAPEHGAIA